MAEAGASRAHPRAEPHDIHVRARAKLNLGLRVVGRRADGFHELDSLFAHLDLADDLSVAVADAGAPFEAVDDELTRRPTEDGWLDPRPLSLDGDNLIRRAFAAYRHAARPLAVPGLHAVIGKRVPWGAGLGGGSADGAAALRAVARLAPSAAPLREIAEALGSDVPFCLLGPDVARVGGRGEIVMPLELPPLAVVLVHPPVAVAAADAYRWWASAPVDVPPMEATMAAWRSGERLPLANALEAGVAARVAPVAEVLSVLRALSLGPVAMSGSGSTCFVVVAGPDEARETAERLRRGRASWWVCAAVVGASA